MADVFSKTKRSQVMARIRSRGNAGTEMRLVSVFRLERIIGWRRHVRVESGRRGAQSFDVRPDFVFAANKLAVFVDGCFWHTCPQHGHTPRSNRQYWIAKLERNRKRDRLVRRGLYSAGWRVLRIWAHELKAPKRVVARVRRVLLATAAQRTTASRPTR